jgi:hypothetical protein
MGSTRHNSGNKLICPHGCQTHRAHTDQLQRLCAGCCCHQPSGQLSAALPAFWPAHTCTHSSKQPYITKHSLNLSYALVIWHKQERAKGHMQSTPAGTAASPKRKDSVKRGALQRSQSSHKGRSCCCVKGSNSQLALGATSLTEARSSLCCCCPGCMDTRAWFITALVCSKTSPQTPYQNNSSSPCRRQLC